MRENGTFIKLDPHLMNPRLPVDQKPFSLLELTSTISYLNNVPAVDIDVARDVCCESPDTHLADTFAKLAQIIMNEKNVQMPSSPQSAVDLYSKLHCFHHVRALTNNTEGIVSANLLEARRSCILCRFCSIKRAYWM